MNRYLLSVLGTVTGYFVARVAAEFFGLDALAEEIGERLRSVVDPADVTRRVEL